MKKILLLLLSLLLCLSLIACNGDTTPDETTADEGEEVDIVIKTTESGSIENNVYTNDYISFKVPESFTVNTDNGSDIITPATPNGDSINLIFSEKDGSFDAITEDELENELIAIFDQIADVAFVKETIDGVPAIRFSYKATIDGLITLNITQLFLDTEMNITLTITDYTGTYTADFASLTSTIDIK